MLARFRFLVFVLAGILVAPDAAVAQHAGSRTVPAAGPRLDATASAMRSLASPDAEAMQVRRANSVGKPLALIIVGGAAIVLGALIGSDIGLLFMIGGAVALLYGLYQYFR